MTTVELAEKIAAAVLEAAYDSGNGFMWEHAHEQAPAVLHCLREHSSWFCRVSDPEDGLTVDTPYEQVQLELYR